MLYTLPDEDVYRSAVSVLETYPWSPVPSDLMDVHKLGLPGSKYTLIPFSSGREIVDALERSVLIEHAGNLKMWLTKGLYTYKRELRVSEHFRAEYALGVANVPAAEWAGVVVTDAAFLATRGCVWNRKYESRGGSIASGLHTRFTAAAPSLKHIHTLMAS